EPPAKTVIPGRLPLVQVAPLFVEVAKPMSDEPPSKNRPSCAVATIVLPKENVSGSTIVRCWLVVLENGSVAICVSATFAEPTIVTTRAEVVTNPSTSATRCNATRFKHRILIYPPLSSRQSRMLCDSAVLTTAQAPHGPAGMLPA